MKIYQPHEYPRPREAFPDGLAGAGAELRDAVAFRLAVVDVPGALSAIVQHATLAQLSVLATLSRGAADLAVAKLEIVTDDTTHSRGFGELLSFCRALQAMRTCN